MAHQQQIYFCQSVKQRLPRFFNNCFVLDIGSLDVNGSNRALFEDCLYLGVDLMPGRNVDLICKGHELHLPDESFEVIISTECFEHDQYFTFTLKNIVRMLKSGGLCMFTCATTGRPEHGTRRTTPMDAPFTQEFGEWGNYYKNLDEADIRRVLDIDAIFETYAFSVNQESHDLYFWGIKKGELIERRDYSFQIQGIGTTYDQRDKLTILLQDIAGHKMKELDYQDQIANLRKSIEIHKADSFAAREDTKSFRDQLNSIKMSHSWRLTAPLRKGHALLRTLLSHDLSGRATVLYRAIPIAPAQKERLKGVFFTLFGYACKHWPAYQSWKVAQRLADSTFHGKPFPPALSTSAFLGVQSLPNADGIWEWRDYYVVKSRISQINARETRQTDLLSSKRRNSDDNALVATPDISTPKMIAFYLPQFHPIPENDKWWGRGFTEWANVTKAQPNFVGHYQPRLPADHGFYDLRIPEVMQQQAELARSYGIHGFCFYYYWFQGKRLLEKPVEQMLATQKPDFPFCLCWANENWTRKWDGDEHEVLMAQTYSAEDDKAVIMDLIRFFRDKRYIRVNGRPLIIVYRVTLFPDFSATASRWRAVCREQGIGEIYITSVESCDLVHEGKNPRQFGCDASIEFPPHQLSYVKPPSGQIINKNFSGGTADYRDLAVRCATREMPPYVRFRGIVPGWDNTARRQDNGFCFEHATPGAFQAWLEEALEQTRIEQSGDERLVFINAWNEWAEGAYLEPDRRFGHSYLEAVKNAAASPSLVPKDKRGSGT